MLAHLEEALLAEYVQHRILLVSDLISLRSQPRRGPPLAHILHRHLRQSYIARRRAYAFFHSASQLIPPPSPLPPFFAARHFRFLRCHRVGPEGRCGLTEWQVDLRRLVICGIMTASIRSSAPAFLMPDKRLHYIKGYMR